MAKYIVIERDNGVVTIVRSEIETGSEEALTEHEQIINELFNKVKKLNKPDVSKSVDVEREALLRDYTDWLWINHNILTNADNNEVALKQYLSRNSC